LPDRPYFTLFSAVTATTTSGVCTAGRNGNLEAQFLKTGTGTGTIEMQTCSVDLTTYNLDPLAENIWVPHELADVTGVTDGKLDVPAGDPWKQKIKLLGVSARRCRFVFTKTAGTLALSGWMSGS
jgi:hypothetical protein